MVVGTRIVAHFPRAPAEIAARASRLPAANLGDAMSRMQSARVPFHRYGGRASISGPALTVRVRAGDNLLLHRALDLAEPGDILVVDGAGDVTVALIGELMASYAASRGIAGFVIDGAVRDVDTLRTLDIGVWARAATPAGPFKDGPGEIGVPVCCGGLVVMPGDLLVADLDGLVVVPREEAEAVVEAAERLHEKEGMTQTAIDEGTWDRAWVTETLKSKGYDATKEMRRVQTSDVN
ncbi:RraA family protein [Hyaloraphidium curvatum]|nr:RraA family protein [Hyaloraphidium curvatum]